MVSTRRTREEAEKDSLVDIVTRSDFFGRVGLATFGTEGPYCSRVHVG